MHKTVHKIRLHLFIGHIAAIAFLAAGTLGLEAQQPGLQSLPPIDLKTSLNAPIDLSKPDLSTPDDLKYSSSTGSAELASLENFNIGADEDQPPPRRRYGRPNYSDSHTNPDGSAKYSFLVGGGFTLPVGGAHNYLATSYNIQAGVARNFSKKFGVQAEFDWANFGFQTATLNNLLAIYNDLGATDQNGNSLTVLGGTSHVWSFTLDPIYNYYTSDTWGAYVVGGLGFYHKTANFTIPGTGVYCDPFYGCYQYQANQTIDKYTSNAFGLNAGLGATYKFSRFASTRFYVEARYVWTDNKPRPFDDSGTTSYFNVFPQNSARTTYIPVTFGVRF